EARLKDDKAHEIKAVCVVHNETSTGCITLINEVRKAIDAAGHPALLMVDAISSLGAIDYRHDEWGVDVTVAGSQKGLMLPPGLGFNAISANAIAASKSARLPRAYWDWQPMLRDNTNGFFPYTPATNLLYGLREALDILLEEGLANVFARHARHGEATRRAVKAWDLEILAANACEFSDVVTTVVVPQPHDADRIRQAILARVSPTMRWRGARRLARCTGFRSRTRICRSRKGSARRSGRRFTSTSCPPRIRCSSIGSGGRARSSSARPTRRNSVPDLRRSTR